MPDVRRSELVAYAVCVALVAVLGWRALRAEDPSARAASPGGAQRSSAAPATVEQASAARVLVHVVGAVRRPGVYRLREGQRVRDAVRHAGGATPGADVQAINLAAKLADAQQIAVPRRAAPGAGGTGAASPAAGTQAPPVSLSTATAEQLDTLDGVGPATAQKILEYRNQHGGFGSIDDLGEIPGIGPKRLEALRGQVQP